MNRGQFHFWLAAGLLVILLPVGAYFLLVEAGNTPQDEAPDPALVGGVTFAVTTAWWLFCRLRWAVRTVATPAPPSATEVVEQEVETALLRCSARERALFDQHRVPAHLTSIGQGLRGRKVHVVALRGSEVILWDERVGGFALSHVTEGFQVLEHGDDQLELSSAIQRWMQDLPHTGSDALQLAPGDPRRSL